jgi:hypothetical protein
MKKEIDQPVSAPDIQNAFEAAPGKNSSINRRKFVETIAVSALTFTILPGTYSGGKIMLPPVIK